MTTTTRRFLRRAACGALLALASTAASAQAPDEPVSHFAADGLEIDGDYLDDPTVVGVDWWPDFEPFRDPIRQEDESLCGTRPSPKNDLTNSYVANDFDFLYVGMERLANRGNTSFFFHFDITGDGPSSGDFIFVFCFGSGDVVTDTYVLEWDETRGEFVRDSTPPSVSFSVNAGRIQAPFGALDRHGRPEATIAAGKFGEAAITLADIEGFDVCEASDVTLEIQTKSSCSLNSQCKDTSGPLRFSFSPLTASLELSQPDSCEPVVVATANADSPRADDVTYRWFLNGEEITDLDPTWATSDTIEIPLDVECGETEVSVLVDDGTCTVEDAGTVEVNRAPEAVISTAVVGACDGVLTYSAAGSTDCNDEPLGYAWDFDGDGVVDAEDESGTWTYTSCGDRTVSLVVTDPSGCEVAAESVDVHVNEPPTAGLAIASSDASCLEISWEVTSTDCDLTTPSALYDEALTSVTDFGDGSPPVEDASGVHRYADCGTYVVTTTTTDASGCEDVVVRTVTIDVVAEVD